MCDGIGTWYGRSLKQDWIVFIFVNWKFKIIIPNSLVKRLSHEVHLEDEISVEILNSVCFISFENIIVTLAELNIWFTGYYSPIVKPTKISTIAPLNASNLRTMSSRESSLCSLSSRLKPSLTSRFIRLSLWPFPSHITPIGSLGFHRSPNTTRPSISCPLFRTYYTLPLFPNRKSAYIRVELDCFEMSSKSIYLYFASNTADGLSAFFGVFLYLQIFFHDSSFNHMY